MTFTTFADAVHRRFADMSLDELFVVDAPDLWEQYLAAWPDGTNPLFRTRTEHDCSTCRHFIRNVGNVVQIVDGRVRSIWAGLDLPEPYRTVADVLDALVSAAPLAGIFRSSEPQYGAATTRALVDGHVETWHHFHAPVAPRHRSNDLGPARGDFLTSVQVFRRGLEDLRPSALESVVDLIDSGVLYRGEEHLMAVTAFRTLQNVYERQVGSARDAFIFANATSRAARFRNTVIGTLVTDLSQGVDLESAVRSFESKVAPTNYKRPKALITPAMVTAAMKTVTDLGIEKSLERRFARLEDVSVNDVLWVDRDVRPQMKDGGLVDVLMAAATPRPTKSPAEPITISAFMKDVLPGASEIELLMKNALVGNFVSLTTGVHSDVPPIFKWGNDFAWSYGGNVTDSIKERVKRAGGNVTGRLRVSLSWFNRDDLDIHVVEPNGNHIWYQSRDGKLDVDMNVSGETREPVENVTWAGRIQDGPYEVKVHNFAQRETSDVGFVIETESDGVIENYRYEQPVGNRAVVPVGVMTVRDGAIVKFAPAKGIHGGSASKTVWNVQTETFVKVGSVMYSPNFWGDAAVGNRHYIFALAGCLNDEPTRGIYNEFLKSDLDKHRKVFEVLGDRTKCAPAADQVSGLGFSSTSGASVTARVTVGGRQRLLAIQF